MDISIIVATHKKYWMPEDNVYIPLHVGREGKTDLGYKGDNTGDNISRKNFSYCELTGLYWGWKNLDCEYIGLCHYRRYFAAGFPGFTFASKTKSIMSREDYLELLKDHDVIVPKKREYYIETVRSHYEHSHYKKDLDLCEDITTRMYPEYSDAFKTVMDGTSLYLLNMYVMPKALSDEYSGWLFPILFTMEECNDISSYDAYQARVYGFLGELLFNVWLKTKRLRIKEVPVAMLEKVNWPLKAAAFIYRKLRGNLK